MEAGALLRLRYNCAVATAADSGRPQFLPQDAPVAVRFASFEARVAAAMLDALVGLIIVALFVLGGSLVVLFSSEFERVDPSDTALYTFWAVTGASLPAVFLYMFIGLAWKGQTLGSAVMQVMAIRSDGRPLGAGGAMARVLGLISYPLLLGVAGVIGYAIDRGGTATAAAVGAAAAIVIAAIFWSLFDSRRRMLHDRLAGTIIVRVV